MVISQEIQLKMGVLCQHVEDLLAIGTSWFFKLGEGLERFEHAVTQGASWSSQV